MSSKLWWKSKTIWAGVIGVIIAVYNSAIPALASGCTPEPSGLCIVLPAIPEWIYGILGAIGVYSRSVAKTSIK